MDRQQKVRGCLNGVFYGDGFGALSGGVSAKTVSGEIVLIDEEDREVARSAFVKLTARQGSTFTLFNVMIGINFHWERAEDQTFQGNLVLKPREDGTIDGNERNPSGRLSAKCNFFRDEPSCPAGIPEGPRNTFTELAS